METQTVKKHHTINIDGRKKGNILGVDDVYSYSENQINMKTSEGDLSIIGKSLKIIKYNTDDGSLSFSGDVDSVKYAGQKTSLRQRLFK